MDGGMSWVDKKNPMKGKEKLHFSLTCICVFTVFFMTAVYIDLNLMVLPALMMFFIVAEIVLCFRRKLRFFDSHAPGAINLSLTFVTYFHFYIWSSLPISILAFNEKIPFDSVGHYYFFDYIVVHRYFIVHGAFLLVFFCVMSFFDKLLNPGKCRYCFSDTITGFKTVLSLCLVSCVALIPMLSILKNRGPDYFDFDTSHLTQLFGVMMYGANFFLLSLLFFLVFFPLFIIFFIFVNKLVRNLYYVE